MNILFIGDIYGRSGREALQRHLPDLKEKLKPDVTIVNGENTAHGLGISPNFCKKFYEWGVDCITTGNHVWDQREILPYIDKDPKLLRPANFPPGTPGNGAYIHTCDNGKTILIINAMARLFMDPLDDPFTVIDALIDNYKLGQSIDAIFIDFHGEATSEKMAFGHYFDGRISAIIGTHTHIPTADAHILEKGTAYQSDAGMTGDYDSVIGVQKNVPIHRFVKKIPGLKKIPADSEGTLCGSYIVTNDKTGLAERIEPIRIGPKLANHLPAIN